MARLARKSVNWLTSHLFTRRGATGNTVATATSLARVTADQRELRLDQRRRNGFRLPPSRPTPNQLPETIDQRISHRRDKQCQQQTERLTADDYLRHARSSSRTRTLTQRDRHHGRD